MHLIKLTGHRRVIVLDYFLINISEKIVLLKGTDVGLTRLKPPGLMIDTTDSFG